MKTDRRKFIRTGAMAMAGTLLLKDTLAVLPKKKGITGLQLYSVRDDMARDPLGSLNQLAAMGWVYVEHASYTDRRFYGYSVTEFKKILDDLGLKMISGHTELRREHWDETRRDFTDTWKYTVEDAAAAGQKYVISSWMNEGLRKTYDDFKWCMDLYNRSGELCRRYGMKFGYHNHDFEFSQKLNGEKIFDIMMKSIDPGMVLVQLDIGNLYNGGAVAMDVVNQYPGRFENIHVKDEIKSAAGEQYESTIVGEGIVNARNVLKLAKKTGGAEVFIVEQEAYQGKTPMECVRKDLEIMTKWGY